MNCVVCGKEVPHRTGRDGGMEPWCSKGCGVKWKNRNNFLFALPGEAVLGLVMQSGALDDDVGTLGRLSQVSKTVRPVAKEHELGEAFQKSGAHLQQKGMRTEVSTTISKVKTGKKIKVERVSKKGISFTRLVDETKDVPREVRRQVPNIVRTDITPDKMFEIALLAYNSAVSLRGKNRPVILYRVASKGVLTQEEKNTQTLSGAVHATVGDAEVWPLEKTAAWIQGALRARVSFVLLNDPRADDILIGGVNKKSDAVFVRELHQITSTRYRIDVATPAERPAAMAGTPLFILRPPEREIGPLPLIPRISKEIWSHTWDSSKSNLALGDSKSLIRDHIRKLFSEAGGPSNLNVPMY